MPKQRTLRLAMVTALLFGSAAGATASTILVPNGASGPCSASQPNGARFATGCGARVTVDSTTPAFVQDNAPDGEGVYRVRFYVEMNAREAMHLIELRSAPQGHPSYRRIAQTMHRLIAERAGHRAIAAAMSFADHSDVELERLEAERAAERRRG